MEKAHFVAANRLVSHHPHSVIYKVCST